jgi:hypothetical protein
MPMYFQPQMCLMKMLFKIEQAEGKAYPIDIHLGGVRARPAQELEAFPSIMFAEHVQWCSVCNSG